MSFNNGSGTQPPPILDAEIKAFLDFQKEDRERHYGKRGRIPKMFAQARDCLVGTNDMAKVQKVAKGMFDDKFKLDISGWDFNNKKFRKAVSEINASHSVIYDIVMTSLDKLADAQSLNNINTMQMISGNSNTPMMLEDPGLMERLKGSVGSVFKPRYQKEKEKAYSMVNDLFSYMKESRVKWEIYMSTHWDNTSKAVDWQQDGNVYEFLEELEALDDCEMRTIFLIDIGYRHLARMMNKEASATVQAMLQAKTASQPQLTGMGAPIMYPPQQPVQGQIIRSNALPIQDSDFS